MYTKRLENTDSGLYYFKVWLIFFTVTLIIILLVQLIVLPLILPSWHAGNGLLVGGDWIGFHKEAVELAGRINDQGWSAWELWPKGWFPAGVAGAFYAIILPEPWVLAPLNAVVHAFAGLLVLKILNLFTQRKSIEIVAVLPFLFFPSAMLWYTQIHRDGYNILGMLLFIYGLLLLLSIVQLNNLKFKSELTGFIFSLSGIVMLWMSRPYTIVLFLYITIILFCFSAVVFTTLMIKRSLCWKRALFKLSILIIIASIITLLTEAPEAVKYLREFGLDNKTYIEIKKPYEQLLWASKTGYAGLSDKVNQSYESKIIREEDFTWERTPILPKSIDDHLFSIALTRSVRYQMIYGGSAINIDSDVVFHKAADFLFYLPRALQIAFLAPFPADWFNGESQIISFFRRISAIEMIIVYFLIIPMICSIWIWRKKIEVYILIIFCTIMMLPIVYSIPNLGTIYRYRYGYLMLLVCLGAAVFLNFVKEKCRKEKIIFKESTSVKPIIRKESSQS